MSCPQSSDLFDLDAMEMGSFEEERSLARIGHLTPRHMSK